MTILRRLVLLVALLWVPALAHAQGLGGFDPVSYFKGDKPLKGQPSISAQHGGITYLFATDANRTAFAAGPERYLPQYGGHCAWAAAQGKTAPADPEVYKVVDGKLYLNYNRDIAARWERDIPGFIKAADAAWPKLKK